MPEDHFGHLATEPIAFLHGVPVVHSTVDARVVDLGDHILEAREGVSGSGHDAVHGEGDLIGAKEGRQGIHHRLGDAAMVGRVLGMSRSHRRLIQQADERRAAYVARFLGAPSEFLMRINNLKNRAASCGDILSTRKTLSRATRSLREITS